MKKTPSEVRALSETMMSDPKLILDKIVEFAVRDSFAHDEAEARQVLPEFMQWLAVRTVADGDRFVMLSGKLDQVIYHPFMITSTRMFLGYFTKEYMSGEILHHEAVLASDKPQDSKIVGECVRYTVELLEECFGKDLHPLLKDWRFALDGGVWAIDGCGGHFCKSAEMRAAA